MIMRRADLRRRCDTLQHSLQGRQHTMATALQQGLQALSALLRHPTFLLPLALLAGALLSHPRGRRGLLRLRPLLGPVLQLLRSQLASGPQQTTASSEDDGDPDLPSERAWSTIR